MKGSKELIEHYNKREEELGEKATKLCMYLEGYAEGYRDTKAYMIDKACEWLESHFRDIENPDFYSKRNHPTDLESMYHWSVKELVDDFRKAMEEHGEG